MVNKFKSILNKFEDLLFVNYSCLSCEREIFNRNNFSLCDECLAKLDVIGNVVCLKCGDKLENNLACNKCANANYKFNRNISYCYYNSMASEIVKKLKYSGKKYFSKYIANMILATNSFPKDTDYITFVPASKDNLKLRGFNQSEEIAREISKIVGVPLITILNKKDGFKNQASLNQSERIENLKNAFFIVDSNKNLIFDKNIVIIDDVFTTGTTLSRCSEEISKCKPKSIISMTFAKTNYSEI